MKRWIHAATKSQSEQASDIANKIWDYIYDVILEQNQKDYYKQVRRQLTVNGKKYSIKNTSPYNTMIITSPEGEELWKSSFDNGVSRNDAKRIAMKIINDAYGDDTDRDNKIVDLTVRANYTSYGSNSGGPVVLSEYVDKLRKYYTTGGDPDGRYFAVMIKAYWSGSDQDVIFSNNADELILMCKDFIAEGAETASPEGSTGVYDYRFYADVVDSETGKELYADKSQSYRK